MKRKIRWKEQWDAYYPNKKDDYLLIKVSPDWLEVVSYKHEILGDKKTWAPPRVLFNND